METLASLDTKELREVTRGSESMSAFVLQAGLAADMRTAQLANMAIILWVCCIGIVLQQVTREGFEPVAWGALTAALFLTLAAVLFTIAIRPGRMTYLPGIDPLTFVALKHQFPDKRDLARAAGAQLKLEESLRRASIWSRLSMGGLICLLSAPLAGLFAFWIAVLPPGAMDAARGKAIEICRSWQICKVSDQKTA